VLNACQEAVRAMTVLKIDGVGIFSSYKGIYLGDPRLEPLMATLNRLGAMVFVHPVTPSAYPDLGLPTFLFEFTFDTTRAAVNMLYHQTYKLHPKIRWLLAHAGGTVPFLAYRTSLLTAAPVAGQNLGLHAIDKQAPEYGRLFYDTALSPAPSAMRSVREVTDLSHILFATDWPFSAPVFVTPGDPAPQLSDTFTTAERLKVERANALAQLPRLAARLAG
jgi:predicted TIM-barrel fold metal-dependent hydrolase